MKPRAPVALCMIVKDAAETIKDCLASARPHVAEINVYLGGVSTDGTPEIIERIAAEPGSPIRVVQGEWRGDFSWARTQSYAMADPALPWRLYLDGDDVLEGGEHLPALIAELERRDAPGAIIGYDYGGQGLDTDPFLRVTRAYSGSWVGRVHEHFVFRDEIRNGRQSERLPELVVARPPLRVTHHRADFWPGRYLPQLREAAEDAERTPRALHYLAEELFLTGDYEGAIDAATRYLATVESTEGEFSSMRSGCLSFLIRAALSAERDDLAVRACEESVGYLRAWAQAAVADPGRVSPIVFGNAIDDRLPETDADILAQAEEILNDIVLATTLRAKRQPYRAPATPGVTLSAPISLCIITKDRIETIQACIESVRPFVTEVNVYDTGSTDGTLELLDRLASEAGTPVHVERGEWRDDFAWARNQSFAMASPEIPWWMWLDSDDVLLRGDLLLETVAEMERKNAPGALIAYDYMGSGDASEFQSFFRVARAHSASWRGIVHEQWLFNDEIRKGRSSERIPELVVARPPLVVRHRRHDHDMHRYTAIMRKAAADLEHNPRAYFFLAETLVDDGAWEEGLDAAQRQLETVETHEGQWTPYRSMALGFLMQAAIGLEQDDLAVATAEELVAYLGAWSHAAMVDPDFVIEPSAPERPWTGSNDIDLIRHAERTLAQLRDTVALRRELAETNAQLAAWDAYRTTYHAPVIPGRNDPCSCGSGKKAKRCCFA